MVNPQLGRRYPFEYRKLVALSHAEDDKRFCVSHSVCVLVCFLPGRPVGTLCLFETMDDMKAMNELTRPQHQKPD